MLRILVPSHGPSGLTFTSFEQNDLPKPPNGIDAEANNDVILLFEDEAEAVEYAEELEDVSTDIDDSGSPIKLAINDIIDAINADGFVKSYLE